MIDTSDTQTETQLDLAACLRAIRFALICIILGFSYLNIRGALSINAFSQLFREMLGNKPLPALTSFVVHWPTLFALISLAIPICALATLGRRNLVRTFYILGILALATTAELIVVFNALSAPLSLILSGMAAGQ